jgi:hypothetical protein
MGSLTQGSPLPAVVKTTQEAKAAPEFYTNYLQDVANLGQNAVTQGGVAGSSPLQQLAYNMAPNMAFAGSNTFGNANNMISNAGNTAAYNTVGNYMNPFMSNVVDEMGRLSNRNVTENVMPNLNAASIGAGGFGSQRQMQQTGNTLRDIQSDLLGKQYGALNTGYNDSMKNAQNDLSRQLLAGEGLTSLGQQQNATSMAGLKALSNLGGEQQALGQKQLDYPMDMATKFAALLRGSTMPTSGTTQETGPMSGAYGQSGLSQIAGFASLLASLANKTGG